MSSCSSALYFVSYLGPGRNAFWTDFSSLPDLLLPFDAPVDLRPLLFFLSLVSACLGASTLASDFDLITKVLSVHVSFLLSFVLPFDAAIGLPSSPSFPFLLSTGFCVSSLASDSGPPREDFSIHVSFLGALFVLSPSAVEAEIEM